jgi:hypothetical protein
VVAPHSLCEDRSIVKTGSGQILVFKNLNKRLLHSFAGALLVIVGLDAIILGNFYGGAHLDASVENVPELKQDPYVQAMMVAWYVSIYSNHPNHNDARARARPCSLCSTTFLRLALSVPTASTPALLLCIVGAHPQLKAVPLACSCLVRSIPNANVQADPRRGWRLVPAQGEEGHCGGAATG